MTTRDKTTLAAIDAGHRYLAARAEAERLHDDLATTVRIAIAHGASENELSKGIGLARSSIRQMLGK